MHIKRLMIFLCLLIGPSIAFAQLEISSDYSYRKQLYGTARQNKQVNRVHSAGLAFFLFNTTGLELSYSRANRIITENNEIPVSLDLSIVSMQNRMTTTSYGIGIRQLLVPVKFRIRPMIGIGVARQFLEDQTDYQIKDKSTGEVTTIQSGLVKRRQDSGYIAMMLQFIITKNFSSRGTVKSYSSSFDLDNYKDDIQYSAGMAVQF